MRYSHETMEEPKESQACQEYRLPEWETTARHRGDDEKNASTTQRATNIKATISGNFNRLMPGHRKYCGLSRRLACIVICLILLALLALILGLAVGLSKRNRFVL